MNNNNQLKQRNINSQNNNFNNNPNNYNNRNNQNNQNNNNKNDGIGQNNNNKSDRINQNNNNNNDNYTNTNNQNNDLQNKYKYRYTNINNKPNNTNENTLKINNNNNLSRNNNNPSNHNYENYNKDNKENNLSNQNGNNNRLNGNHVTPKTQNKSYQNDDSKRNLNNLSDNNNYDKGVNQLSQRENQNQTKNSISEKTQNLKKSANENQSNQNLYITERTPTYNNDEKNKNEITTPKELKKDKNLSNNSNLNDNNNSSHYNQNKKESKSQINGSNQSNINEDTSINSKAKSLEFKVGETLKNNETSKIISNHKCMKCNNIIANNNNIDICKNCFKDQIYEFTFNYYLADISSALVVTKIFEEQLELNLKKNEKGKKYLLSGAIRKYNEIFKGENLNQKQIINEIKKKLCVYCAEEIKGEFLELPCKCVLCGEEHLNEYLNSTDLTKEQCLCSETYNGEMLFKLGNFIIDKNIDYKNKIVDYFEKQLKGNCCICGKRYDITLEDVNYLNDSDNNYNEFLSNLNHNFCNECYLLYSEKEFDCLICKVKHTLPN